MISRCEGSEARVIDISDYLNSKDVFGIQSDAFINDSERFANELIAVGQRHAKNRIVYNVEISMWYNAFLDAQKKQQNVRSAREMAEQELLRITYTAVGEARFLRKCRECKERSVMQMRNLIPIPYAIFGAVSLLFTVVFGTLFGVFLFTPYTIMNPFVNLIYFIGSLGVFVTVIAAIKERKAGKL